MPRSGWTWMIAIALPLAASSMQACGIGHHWDDDDDGWHDDDDGWNDDDDGNAGPPAGYGTGNTEPHCPVGGPGCPCTSQHACDPMLECVNQINTCVIPDDCAIGSAGCECTAGGTCDPGFICKEQTCVSEMPCHPEDTGTEGCQCTAGGACDPGLNCFSDACVQLPDEEAESSSGGGADGSTSSSPEG